jgi:hypothetical protein
LWGETTDPVVTVKHRYWNGLQEQQTCEKRKLKKINMWTLLIFSRVTVPMFGTNLIGHSIATTSVLGSSFSST